MFNSCTFKHMNQENPSTNLIRGLTFIDAFCIVVGGTIGTGVFIKTAVMAQSVGSAGYVMLAWVVAGLLSLSGALVYAEIGSRYPQAGGEYVYLRESFGTFTAYLYGWTRVLIASPGSLAAYAVGAAIFLSGGMNLDYFGGIPGTAIFFILFFSVINCFKVVVGGRLQTIMTFLKIALIVGLGILLFVSGKGETHHFFEAATENPGWRGFGPFSAAMLAALWAYDGWNNLPMMSGEIKDSKRNVPLSLIFGMLAILFLYSFVNLAYFYILPGSEILNSTSETPVATKAVQWIYGPSAAKIMSFMFVISALGALNGATMSFARVPYAMAKDGVFFKLLGRVHLTTHVPVISVVIQGIVSCIFVACLNFDKLTNYVVFSSWIFYALVTASIFKLRKTHGSPQDGYKTWGYPWMPIIFITLATALLVYTFIDSTKDSLIGLAIIAAGIPFYFVFRKNRLKQN